MSRRICFVGLVCALFMSPLSFALASAAKDTPEARQWLEKMQQSARELSYEGVFVYLRANRLATMKVVHVADDSGIYEWLISLDGVPREVLRSSRGFTGIFQGKSAVTVDKNSGMPIRPSPLKVVENMGDMEAVGDFYTMTLGGSDRTTGLPSQIVTLHPQDSYRYGYRVWLDKTTGLLLKSDVIKQDGVAVEQVMYTTIDVFKTLSDDLRKKVTAIKARTVDSETPVSKDITQHWQVRQAPKGFVLEEYYRHPARKNRTSVEQMVFSDGLASVSVFVEAQRKKEAMLFEGAAEMGAINVYGVVVNGQQVTVVGEVPPLTVRLIGDSVRYVD
ncbi:MAG: hypothetical protein GXP10_09525 [Gammaproteobacteria bacterium]|nr:hypothetical protein [Gammaproteobacteria bacterium]